MPQDLAALRGATAAATPRTSIEISNWRDKTFLSLQRAASILDVSRGSLYALEKAGRLSFRRLNGRTLTPVSEIVALIDNVEFWSPPAKGTAARDGAQDAA
jgi:hypothetical protein